MSDVVTAFATEIAPSVAGNETLETGAGDDSFIVKGDVEHQASALADSVVVDVFTPCREDYIG